MVPSEQLVTNAYECQVSATSAKSLANAYECQEFSKYLLDNSLSSTKL